MKKIYSLVFAISSLFAVSQNSFQIKDLDNGSAVVVNNQVITLTTTPSAIEVKKHFEIKNTSAVTHSYVMRKFENQMNTVVNPTDMASAYFCFNTLCFIPTTMSGTITLNANASFSFIPKFDEASVVGQSNISYEFSDMANGSDALTMDFQYNYPVSVKEASMKILAVSGLYPNPAISKSSIDLTTEKEMDNVSLKVYNSLGVAVTDKKVDLSKGKNSVAVDATNLDSGIYFVSVGNGNNKIVKKLIITK